MKLFSWMNEDKSEGEATGSDGAASTDPASMSPALQARLRELGQMKVTEVMIPRALVTALDADVQLKRVRRLKSAKVAFFPVYKGDLDHILGWIPKQRVLELLQENSEENTLARNVRSVGVVLESASVADLADIFLESSSPFLVVKNAAGATTGIVPLAEFVELLFGFELSPPAPTPMADGGTSTPRGYEL